jgi:hypothetical protein
MMMMMTMIYKNDDDDEAEDVHILAITYDRLNTS